MTKAAENRRRIKVASYSISTKNQLEEQAKKKLKIHFMGNKMFCENKAKLDERVNQKNT